MPRNDIELNGVKIERLVRYEGDSEAADEVLEVLGIVHVETSLHGERFRVDFKRSKTGNEYSIYIQQKHKEWYY